MALYRPGGFEITRSGMEACGFNDGAKILDIGCGTGETIEFLKDEMGLDAVGIDASMEMVRLAKDKNSKLDIKYGDGEFLDDFASFTFDGVIMECVLSLINLPDEAMHEAYCVLKKGGKLVITDLYIKNPEQGMVKALKIEAQRLSKIPHSHGECSDDCSEEHKKRVVNFRTNGKFLKEPLISHLEENGYKILLWEDRSKELDEFVAEKLMAGENMDKYFCGKGDCKAIDKGTGYFMVIAEKPQ